MGEGALWHPLRGTLFWFDIHAHCLYERGFDDKPGVVVQTYAFDECVSAAAWVDETRLLIASETALFEFNLRTRVRRDIAPLEADNPKTRSNDGRADPFGGFWMSTMGKNAEPGAGTIYRYHRGEVRVLFSGLTIPNAICFAPGGEHAYFCDTPTQKIMRVVLDADGWPSGAPTLFAHVAPFNPDGAVVDSAGCLWSAQWGAHRVARYGADGVFTEAIQLPAAHISCPAFGGSNFTTLFATSATEHIAEPSTADGKTFYCNINDSISDSHSNTLIQGQAEPRVVLA